MRYLVVILWLYMGLYGQNRVTPGQWWLQAPEDAKAAILDSYNRNMEYDVGYTLAAFKAIESAGDQFTLKLGENSCGGYAQRAKYVAARVWGLPVDSLTAWQIDRACQQLIQDQDFDDRQARLKLQELQNIHGNDWMSIWADWNSKKPGQAESVREWIRFLRIKIGEQ